MNRIDIMEANKNMGSRGEHSNNYSQRV